MTVMLILLAMGYGLAGFGLAGGATALIVGVGLRSSLSIAAADYRSASGMSSDPDLRGLQQLGGLLCLILVAVGAYVGGWRMGWAWAPGGYALGAGVSVLATWAFARRRTAHNYLEGQGLPTTAESEEWLRVVNAADAEAMRRAATSSE